MGMFRSVRDACEHKWANTPFHAVSDMGSPLHYAGTSCRAPTHRRFPFAGLIYLWAVHEPPLHFTGHVMPCPCEIDPINDPPSGDLCIKFG